MSAAVFKASAGPIPEILASDGSRLLALRPGNAPITAVEIEPVSPRPVPVAVSPNPARGRVWIEIRAGWDAAISGGAPTIGRFALDVFDVTGRLVRRIEGNGGGAGLARVAWDGRDANGRSVASGRYWVRMVEPNDAVGPAVPVIFLR
jgi:hypothetical protein